MSNLISKIQDRSLVLGILGLGYVGLPLAVEFAKKGIRTIGFEIDSKKVSQIMLGFSYIPDILSETVAKTRENDVFSATTDFSLLTKCDAVIVCVPTPLNEQREPDVTYIESSAQSIGKYLKQDQLLILESTTYPRTTEDVFIPLLQKTSGLVVGVDFHVVFSPERIDPGNQKFGVHNTPKVVGGVGADASLFAKQVYEIVTEKVVMVSSPTSAEMVKLLENTYRSVNIALANEFALICEKLNLNVWEIISAASTKPFGFMPFFPGPGVGGHCIPIDPLYLSWKMRTLGYKTKFIDMADEINTYMPHHVIDLVTKSLNQDKKAVNGSSILILGVAYKKDIDDFRESPSLEIIKGLVDLGADVSYHDPFVPKLKFELHGKRFDMDSVLLEDVDVLKLFSAIVIATDHSVYKEMLDALCDLGQKLIDTRNLLGGVSNNNEKIVRL